MKINNTLMMAAFSLLSALSAQAANIQIMSLPKNITTPGTYVLTANLTCPTPVSAITINLLVAGRVIIDLNGFTLSPYPNTGSLVGAILILGNPTASKIIIQNGTIYGFWVGVDVNPNGAVQSPLYLSNIHVQNVTFANERSADVVYNQVNSSSVSDCVFTGGTLFGIQDFYSQTGNQYSNISFNIGQNTALQVSTSGPGVLQYCHFSASTN
jgi:hypothetical protein